MEETRKRENGRRRETEDRNLLNLLNLENDFEQNCEKKDRAETVRAKEEKRL